MMKFFIACDIFGYEFHLLRDGNFKNKTKIGFLLTFLYLLILIALFFGFGIDLYTRKNPKSSFNSLSKPHELKNLTNNQFIFAYRIEDYYSSEIIDESIINIEFITHDYKLVDGDWKYINKTINKTRCQDLSNIDIYEKNYNYSFKNWFCIDFENHLIGGNWDGNFVNLLNLQTKQCQNNTANNYNCQPQEKIIKSFKTDTESNYYFSYLFIEAFPTLDDYNHPIKSRIVSRYEMLDIKITKKNIHLFKETTVNDDKGWIFSDIDLKSIYGSDNIQQDFKMKDENDEVILFNYFLYLGNKYEIYNRSYMKVQEVIGSIGGFSKFFYILVSLMYGHICNIFKNFDLIENIAYDNFNNKINNTDIPLIYNKIELRNSNNPDLKIPKVNNLKYNLNPNFIIRNKFFCKKTNDLNKDNIIRLYETINKYHNNIFDVKSFLNLFKEFNLIKKLFLNDFQMKALKIIKNNYLIEETDNSDQFSPSIHEYLSRNETELNKKLITLLNIR